MAIERRYRACPKALRRCHINWLASQHYLHQSNDIYKVVNSLIRQLGIVPRLKLRTQVKDTKIKSLPVALWATKLDEIKCKSE